MCVCVCVCCVCLFMSVLCVVCREMTVYVRMSSIKIGVKKRTLKFHQTTSLNFRIG